MNNITSEPHLLSLNEYQRFGFALAAVDINHDGIDDLVVSAPSYGIDDNRESGFGVFYPKSYYGRIYVYLGK